MSITEPTIASDPIKADTLRLELKAWEKAFASTHEGRKASREDIKQHPTIGTPLLLAELSFQIRM